MHPTPGISDHDTTILADIDCHPQRTKAAKRKVFMWNRTNIAELKADLVKELDPFIKNNTIDTPINTLWQNLKSIIDTIKERCVPSRLTSSRYTQPWINRACKSQCRKKKRAYKRAKSSGLKSDWDIFRQTASATRKACKTAYNSYVHESVSPNIKQNPKRFFSYIKSKRCDNEGGGEDLHR